MRPFSLFLLLSACGPDTRGDYLADQMVDMGCSASSPCNFRHEGGPGVYACTTSYPDISTIQTEFGSPGPIDMGANRPRYIIYEDGTGEPDADVNRNDLFPPKANPEMLGLQARGKELGCRTVNPKAFESPYHGPEWSGDVEERYSCIVSTCEAWVTDGKVQIRKKLNLPDGA